MPGYTSFDRLRRNVVDCADEVVEKEEFNHSPICEMLIGLEHWLPQLNPFLLATVVVLLRLSDDADSS